jgi:hypothetical protein
MALPSYADDYITPCRPEQPPKKGILSLTILGNLPSAAQGNAG